MAIDSRLFMEIGIVNTTFQAIDRTPYERWIQDGVLDDNQQHVVLQRLIFVDDTDSNKTIYRNLIVASTVQELRDSCEVGEISNGLYYYQKMILPVTNTHTGNEVLWYNKDDDAIYYYDSDSDESIKYNIWKDFDDVYSILRDKYPGNCFYFDDYSFSIYDLVKCYVLMEKDRINNYVKNNCMNTCTKNSDLQQRSDVLLAAIMVINNLLENEEFFEAQQILNQLTTCGHLCREYDAQNINNCGCGKA